MIISTELLRINALVSGFIITAGLYVQALKIFRTKSAKDLSVTLLIALLYNECSWFSYGIGIGEWPIIAVTVAALPAEIAMVVGYRRYGTSSVEKNP